MARRWTGHMNGERYLGNTSKKEVHDLDNEKTGANQCQIDEIIRAGNDKPFTTLTAAHNAGNDKPFTTLTAAHNAGYDNCAYCIGSSTR